MGMTTLERELKRGSAELLILALLEEQERHGYQISQLIAERSNGVITFHATSLYPTLYRLEEKGLIEGRWVEKAHTRRRRYYRLTPGGRGVLAKQRAVWETFSAALTRIAAVRDELT
jgi:PadR family transcriptional regulator PadR